QNEFLREWKDYKELYLDILLQLEGPPEPRKCSHCLGGGTYRCPGCFGMPLFCTSCCGDIHRTHPFHRVEQWTGTHFQESSLRLVCFLISFPKSLCLIEDVPQEVANEEWESSQPVAWPPHLWVPDTPAYLVVVDTSSVHYCNLAWCNCPGSPDPHIQLLGAGIFPVSTACLSTVFTFKILDDFLCATVECGTAAMNYFSKLKRITSNVFPHLV
ncbi:hypothetical protein PAXRUDRAFT_76446, partial [Paxillus rubicundulus Ve08.2h10]